MPHYIGNFPFTPNAPIICVNGTVIYDHKEDKLLREFPIESHYGDVIDYFDQNHAHEIKNYEAYGMDDYQLINDCKVGEIKNKFENTKVYKLLFRFHKSEDAARAMAEAISLFGERFHFNRSWPYGLEMHCINSGKGNGLLLLKSELCRGIHTTIAVGDYENDITMLQDADISYATDNAPNHVKAHAKKSAPSHKDHALAFVIDELAEKVSK